jgi:hypothetical protein
MVYVWLKPAAEPGAIRAGAAASKRPPPAAPGVLRFRDEP